MDSDVSLNSLTIHSHFVSTRGPLPVIRPRVIPTRIEVLTGEEFMSFQSLWYNIYASPENKL